MSLEKNQTLTLDKTYILSKLAEEEKNKLIESKEVDFICY